MKKLSITLLLGWLLLLSSNLNAQNREGLFNLKEGDWFEMQVNASFNFNKKDSSQFINKIIQAPLSIKDSANCQLNLRYQLSKQLTDGNQIYNVSVERANAKMFWSPFGSWLGYDSYYPPYKENNISPPKKFQFEMEVNPDGNILRFDPNADNPDPKLRLTGISPNLKQSFHISFSLDILTPDYVKGISNMINMFSVHKEGLTINKQDNCKIDTKHLTESKELNIANVIIDDTIHGQIQVLKESGIPFTIWMEKALSGPAIMLTGASFPIPGNTLIKGMLKDQLNKQITIRYDFYHIFASPTRSSSTKLSFKTRSDGSFLCPLFLTGPQHLNITIGDKSIWTFMEPGDSLNISGIGESRDRVWINGVFWDDSNSHLAPELWNTHRLDFYSGSVSYNTMLSIEMYQYIYYLPGLKDIPAMLVYQAKMKQKVNEILAKYEGKASETCIDFFRTKAMYYLAADKFYFFDSQKYTRISDEKGAKTSISFTDYPPDFFAEADTMPILLNPYNWETDYNQFLLYSQLIKQKRLGLSIGQNPGNGFLENYYFSQASLSGYPLYTRMADLIDRELRNGLTKNEIIEPYYLSFINNCTDPTLTEPLKKVFKTAGQLKAGNNFPLSYFVLPDSSIFSLEKYKGKPVCLILMNGEKKWITEYRKEIEKFKPEEVEFIFAVLPNNYSDKRPPDSAMLAKANVKVIDVNGKLIEDLMITPMRGKIFLLDKWLRIVDDNVENPIFNGSKKFEEAIKKAINATRYSKAEKTAMVKTAGWSFGSILFTLLAGLVIYRIRVRRIRAQEAVKRRIKELEIKAIRSQMNPHFIFNALNSIQSLINGNQFKEANIYLSKFAVLLRGVLNNSEKSRISLSDELRAVELYCQLEQLRFEFKFEISIDPEVNCDLVEIPGMIIQPLAENAIVHGLSAKGDAGKLNIRVERQDGHLYVGVSDNGAGLSPKLSDSLSQKRFGLKLVEERIKILNLDGNEARLTVTNNRNNIGTIATLTLPID